MSKKFIILTAVGFAGAAIHSWFIWNDVNENGAEPELVEKLVVSISDHQLGDSEKIQETLDNNKDPLFEVDRESETVLMPPIWMKYWQPTALTGFGLKIDQRMIDALEITEGEVTKLNKLLKNNLEQVLALEKTGSRQFRDMNGNQSVEITPDAEAMKLVKKALTDDISNVLGGPRSILFLEGLKGERMFGDGVLNAEPRVVTVFAEGNNSSKKQIMVTEINKFTGRETTRQMSLGFWKLRYGGILPIPE